LFFVSLIPTSTPAKWLVGNRNAIVFSDDVCRKPTPMIRLYFWRTSDVKFGT
jgi:hypothetical protein